MLGSILRNYLLRIPHKREPEFIIGEDEDPYLLRWYFFPRNRFFNIYLHKFLRDDDDEALHCHPWWNLSYLLKGSYYEHTISEGGVNYRRRLETGNFKFRFGGYPHRIELIENNPCWTLFITGPRYRQWGFHCSQKWIHWKDFTAVGNKGKIGKGCNQ